MASCVRRKGFVTMKLSRASSGRPARRRQRYRPASASGRSAGSRWLGTVGRLITSRSAVNASASPVLLLFAQAFTLASATCNVDQQYSCAKAVADNRLSYLSGGGECIAKPYVQFTHLCSVNNYLPTVDFCCCMVPGRDITGTSSHVTYDTDPDSSATSAGALCCRYHQDWNHFRCLDVDDAVMLAEVSNETHSDDGYLQLPVAVFVPAVLSSLALIVCCLSCCLRCCNCCLATREHQSLLNPTAAAYQSQRSSDSVHDDNHVTTTKVVPGYCDVVEDNMAPAAAASCHAQQHHQHHQHQYHHQHWTIAPPPPMYCSTSWDLSHVTPLQPSAPQFDPAHLTRCDDETVTSRTHYVIDSSTIAHRDAALSTDNPLQSSVTCSQCRRQRPVCV